MNATAKTRAAHPQPVDRRPMKLTILTLAAAVLLGACSAPHEPAEVPAGPAHATPSAPEPTYAEPTYAEPSYSEDDDTTIVTWGEPITWADGISAVIAEPHKFTPSSTAVGTETYSKIVRMNVTLTNNSGTTFDPSLAFVSASGGSEECDEVIDFESGLEGSPSSQVRPGRKVSYQVAFACKSLSDLQISLTPGFEYTDGLWAEETR